MPMSVISVMTVMSVVSVMAVSMLPVHRSSSRGPQDAPQFVFRCRVVEPGESGAVAPYAVLDDLPVQLKVGE